MNMLIQIFQSLIELLYHYTGDYGIAIVLITVIIRTIFIPFNIKQRKQIKKQQEFSEKIENIKHKYRRNNKKRNDELQKIYQESGTGVMGCLPTLLQIPLMWCLYHAIRQTMVVGTATKLLPWVSSLLVKDQMLILPIATLVVQLLPQIYPYIRFFKQLNLQKAPFPMIITMFLANSFFVFAIPSGIGLYYFISGLFIAVEQLVGNLFALHHARVQVA
ncbi:MAG: membrane protein insertase YidC [Lachnospiraceae bacterium]|nr:membrane protein insertase YidC [Lachnospiraceae bacterium]